MLREADNQLGINEVVFTSKDENIQSQRSVDKIGATLFKVQDGYRFYALDLEKKFGSRKGK